MQHGFYKVAAASPKLQLGNALANASATSEFLSVLNDHGVCLAVFPELNLTGSTLGDLIFRDDVLSGAKKALSFVLKRSKNVSTVAVVGLPLFALGNLYNVAAVIHDGKLLGIVPKEHLTRNEQRFFAPAPKGLSEIALVLDGKSITVPFGSDLLFSVRGREEFTFGIEIGADRFSLLPPSVRLAHAGATVIANPCASPALVGEDVERLFSVSDASKRLLCGIISASANSGESTTDSVFSGQCIIAETGKILEESAPFEEGIALSEIDVHALTEDRLRLGFECAAENATRILFDLPLMETALTRAYATSPFVPEDEEEATERASSILRIQAEGLLRRLVHTRAKTLVLGLSGGLDSTVALLVAREALTRLNRPMTDLIAITMPCFGTTERTKSNAEKLAKAMGATLRVIDISNAVKQHFADIGQDETLHDVTFENAQARERTQVLMDVANQTGGLVVGTGDVSVLALGWASYNGDHMSMYGVNAGVPKTLLPHIVNAAKADADEALASVLEDILKTPVSPELLPPKDGTISQKTEELVGPYELHDFFLYYTVRRGFAKEKLSRIARYAFEGIYSNETVDHWLNVFERRFFAQQFKRSCLPDGPQIGSVCLSPRGAWAMPSDVDPIH